MIAPGPPPDFLTGEPYQRLVPAIAAIAQHDAAARLLTKLSLGVGFQLALVTVRPQVARAVVAWLAAEVPRARREQVALEYLAPAPPAADDVVDLEQLVANVLEPLDAARDTQARIVFIDASAARADDRRAWISLFRLVNRRRNSISRSVAGALVMLLSPELAVELAHEAPDLWSVRSYAEAIDVPAEVDTAAPDEPTVGAAAPDAPPTAPRFDLFLAHPAASKPSARALYELLQPDVRVFLDERSIQPGDRWDQKIPAAQRASRATVILVSSHADAAWYLGDEIVTAIALHRAAPAAHLLVPVLLDRGAVLPYGLTHVQAIDAAAAGGLPGVAARLRGLVVTLRGQPAPSPAIAPVTVAGSVGAVGGGGTVDHVRLHERLARVTDTVFETILLRARVDRSLVSPRSAPLADRILDVAQLAAVDEELGRRIAAELDQRAPWAR